MADTIYVAIFVLFTALCIAYVSWCDRIIGTDEPTIVAAAGDTDTSNDSVTP